ncbi:MAG: MBOAT family protein [Candidatus Omnitrophica bacterium]|nr:MBOAT family protein [Candidatus Omnitrophota bacterium]
MLFNSYEFIFVFLPITLSIFFLLGRFGYVQWAMGWLLIASLIFYSWWNPAYFWLIAILIILNYLVGNYLRKLYPHSQFRRKLWLILGVVGNLSVLGYYKYANFFIDNVNWMMDAGFPNYKIILPLGISFFTFQKIAYLVDSYQGETKKYAFLHYALFVTFYPQLIAGPITHYKELLEQFEDKNVFRYNAQKFALGITVFTIGLFKKVMIADYLSPYAASVFGAAHTGQALNFLSAWIGVLCYTFQIYFDFSGYSDMAIGLAQMVGIKLPINFNSPYKSVDIIDFWRRWHITLSRFLRDYLYIPLGGNRKGEIRRYVNLFLVMVIGGAWHGANWTFVIWGTCHGIYLIINHFWRNFTERMGWVTGRAQIWMGRVLTFFCVVLAWVFFRADNIKDAAIIFKGMFGLSASSNFSLSLKPNLLVPLITAFLASWFLPNTLEFMRNYDAALNFDIKKIRIPKCLSWLSWEPRLIWSVLFGVVFLVCIFNMMKVSAFLYFQF